MKTEYWHEKWESNEIGFHQDKINNKLIEFYPSESTRTFVPLCGKSLDMTWILSQGSKVIGVELSPIACESFFKENKIPYDVTPRDDFNVYSGKGIEIWCGDFFDLPSSVLMDVDLIYDRASLIALPKNLRKSYVSKIRTIPFRTKPKILLLTFDYPDSGVEGPPFCVEKKEVKRLYHPTYSVLSVDRSENQFLKQSEKFSSLAYVDTVTYLLG